MHLFFSYSGKNIIIEFFVVAAATILHAHYEILHFTCYQQKIRAKDRIFNVGI